MIDDLDQKALKGWAGTGRAREKLHWGHADQIWTNRDQSHELKNGHLLELSVNIEMMEDHLMI